MPDTKLIQYCNKRHDELSETMKFLLNAPDPEYLAVSIARVKGQNNILEEMMNRLQIPFTPFI